MARFEVVEGRFVVLVGPEDETLLVTGLLPGEDECARAILAIRLFATMADRYDRRHARHSGPYFVLKGGDDSVLATSCACQSADVLPATSALPCVLCEGRATPVQATAPPARAGPDASSWVETLTGE